MKHIMPVKDDTDPILKAYFKVEEEDFRFFSILLIPFSIKSNYFILNEQWLAQNKYL